MSPPGRPKGEYRSAQYEGTPVSTLFFRTYGDVRAALLERREIALLDVREEEPFSKSHPLFAADLPLSRLELEATSLSVLPQRRAALQEVAKDATVATACCATCSADACNTSSG
jgi:hypothetical protein